MGSLGLKGQDQSLRCGLVSPALPPHLPMPGAPSPGIEGHGSAWGVPSVALGSGSGMGGIFAARSYFWFVLETEPSKRSMTCFKEKKTNTQQ